MRFAWGGVFEIILSQSGVCHNSFTTNRKTNTSRVENSVVLKIVFLLDTPDCWCEVKLANSIKHKIGIIISCSICKNMYSQTSFSVPRSIATGSGGNWTVSCEINSLDTETVVLKRPFSDGAKPGLNLLRFDCNLPLNLSEMGATITQHFQLTKLFISTDIFVITVRWVL